MLPGPWCCSLVLPSSRSETLSPPETVTTRGWGGGEAEGRVRRKLGPIDYSFGGTILFLNTKILWDLKVPLRFKVGWDLEPQAWALAGDFTPLSKTFISPTSGRGAEFRSHQRRALSSAQVKEGLACCSEALHTALKQLCQGWLDSLRWESRGVS